MLPFYLNTRDLGILLQNEAESGRVVNVRLVLSNGGIYYSS